MLKTLHVSNTRYILYFNNVKKVEIWFMVTSMKKELAKVMKDRTLIFGTRRARYFGNDKQADFFRVTNVPSREYSSGMMMNFVRPAV